MTHFDDQNDPFGDWRRLARSVDLETSVHRIVSGAPITPRELRLAGYFALVWFAMDVFWFVSTLNHWFGL